MVSQQEASKRPENVVKLQPDDMLSVPFKSEAPCLPKRESPFRAEGRLLAASEVTKPGTATRSNDRMGTERALDSRLHDLIADSCGNAFLAKEIGRLKILFRAFRDVAWERDEARNDYHRLVEETGEHLAIVEALLGGDAKEAAHAMARHIRSGLKYWSRALPGRPVAEPDPQPQLPNTKRSRR